MKKIILLGSSIVLALLLTGCAQVDEYLEKQIEKKSGISENADYQKYQTYSDQGNLDQEGYYFDDEVASDSPTDTFATITFAENAYLNVEYYSNEALTISLDTRNTIFKENDRIYAKVSVNKEAPSSEYKFEGFRLVENDKNGERVELQTIIPGDDNFVFQITEPYAGKDLSLIPLGDYQSREVKLRASYLDNNEKEYNLSTPNAWTVNDKPIDGEVAEINPVSSYIISYNFNGDEYFYVSSEPECYYSNNEDGIVIFNKKEANEKTNDYSVQLHQYVSVSLPSNSLRYVTVNNGLEQEIKVGKALEINRLKYGDRVVIVSDIAWPELENSRDLILLSSETLTESNQQCYRYTLVVPQKGGEFAFNPEDYTYAHGTLSFKCFGEEVTSVQYLAEGSKIVYEQCTADDGYWLPEGDHIITVSTPEETKKALESISFAEKIRVNVQLKQPEYGGRIEYYVDGSRIDTDIYKGDSGTKITMKFYPWEGWINNYNNGEQYTITKSLTQTVQIDKKEVSISAFSESPNHKPSLTVVIDESVGVDMKFGFEASGLRENDQRYEEKWYRNSHTIIDKRSIGTEKGITITMGNHAVQTGTAIKILIEMKGEDKSGNKIEKVNKNYYRLVDSLTDLQEPINIYDSETMGDSSIWYESINITIGVVDVKKFTQPNKLENGSIVVRNCGNKNIVLSNGDIIEGSEKVTVTISAKNGYYVDGKNVKNGVYQTTIKYDKYLSEIETIIASHPIKKYCNIKLNSDDAYGTCDYKYNGKSVSGNINVKPGEEITLEYTITETEYAIEGSNGLLWTDIGKDKKTSKLTISENDDGRTLTRESFGIKLIRKVG